MPTDAQLLARISSDATGEALRALYRAYAGELYGFALNALGDRGTAEEVVQEVFTRAWRHAEAYDPTRGCVRTWLYQIARHAIIDTRRRAAVRPALALHEPREEQDPEGLSIERAMLGWQVAAALEKLTPEHRQVIRLAHVQGLSVQRDRRAAGAARGHRQKPYVVRTALAAADPGGNGSAGMTHVHEDIGAYVLGALDEDAERRVRAHLPTARSARPRTRSSPGCPACWTSRWPRARATRSRSRPRSRNACWIASRVSTSPSRRASARWRPRIALALPSALAGAAVACAALVLG